MCAFVLMSLLFTRTVEYAEWDHGKLGAVHFKFIIYFDATLFKNNLDRSEKKYYTLFELNNICRVGNINAIWRVYW